MIMVPDQCIQQLLQETVSDAKTHYTTPAKYDELVQKMRSTRSLTGICVVIKPRPTLADCNIFMRLRNERSISEYESQVLISVDSINWHEATLDVSKSTTFNREVVWLTTNDKDKHLLAPHIPDIKDQTNQ